MVICKYYLKGICRFGSNCSYEHPRDLAQNYSATISSYDQNGGGANRYKYYSNTYVPPKETSIPQQTNLFSNLVASSSTNFKNQQSVDQLKENEFLQIVNEDMRQWLNSNQWKLSCYSPIIGKAPPMPIFEDYSPEEIRYGMNTAMKSNNLQQVVYEFQNKVNFIKDCMRKMMNPDRETKNYLIKYNEEAVKLFNMESDKNRTIVGEKQKPQIAEYSNSQMVQSSTNVLANIIQNKAESLANEKQIINHNLFQNQFQFQSQQFKIGSEKFVQATSSQQETQFTQNVFQQPSQVSFQNYPNQLQTQQNQTNLVTNTIQTPTNNLQSVRTTSYYTNIQDLNDDDIQEFGSNVLRLGKIPMNPPSKDFC